MRGVVTYLEINLIQYLYGGSVVAIQNVLPNLPSLFYSFALVLWTHVGFLAEVLGGFGIAFHCKIVQNQSVNITMQDVSHRPSGGWAKRGVYICKVSGTPCRGKIVFSAWVSRRDSH